MQLQMTERDKKLIVFLAIFVILVAGGYWGVYPAVKGIIAVNEQIADARALRELNEVKIAQAPLIEAENQNMKGDLSDLRGDFFPMMTSAQVDRYLTGLILDYGLYAYDLDIAMPTAEAQVEPYQYSKKAAEAAAQQETAAAASSETGMELEHTGADDTQSAELSPETILPEDISTGIYAVAVSMRVGGEKADIQRLIDDLSQTDEKLHLLSFQWGAEDSMSFEDDGSYEVAKEHTLTMSINLYMCEE